MWESDPYGYDRPKDFAPNKPGEFDPREQELADTVGGRPLENLTDYIHKVNPDNGLTGKAHEANCADGARVLCDILNGERPRVASGIKSPNGEHPDTTLEWMGLEDVPPAYKFNRPPGTTPGFAADQQALQLVRDALAGRPPGTHANIGVDFASGKGHRLAAVVDQNGDLKWLDPQPSKAARSHPDGSDAQKNAQLRDMVKHSNQTPIQVPEHINRLEFSVREPGGQWEGVKRDPNTPPASQRRYYLDPRTHGSHPDFDPERTQPIAREVIDNAQHQPYPTHQPDGPYQQPGQQPYPVHQSDGPYQQPGHQPYQPGHQQPGQPPYQPHQQPGQQPYPPRQPDAPYQQPGQQPPYQPHQQPQYPPHQQPGQQPPYRPGHGQPEQPRQPERGSTGRRSRYCRGGGMRRILGMLCRRGTGSWMTWLRGIRMWRRGRRRLGMLRMSPYRGGGMRRILGMLCRRGASSWMTLLLVIRT